MRHRAIVDIHVLQTVPPSNLNRDDTGSPKSAVYGGTRRSRVSSQAWKRATRAGFGSFLRDDDLGVRTKRLVELVADEIDRLDETRDNATDLAKGAVEQAGFKVSAPRQKKKDAPEGTPQTEYLVFLSRHQVRRLAELAIAAEKAGTAVDAKAARAAADTEHSIDIALFGRMVADAADLNVDACAQVAHALSVHPVDNEYDYFTAVDDRTPDDTSGAGMIGTVEFNSSTLYRYATVDVAGLAAVLGDDSAAHRAVQAFVRSFVTSMPTGKQNTFANRTLPDAVVVSVRDSQSVNLVGAFEEAIESGAGQSRLRKASQSLADYAESVDAAYGTSPWRTLVVRVGAATEPLASMGEQVSLDDLVSALGSTLDERAGARA